jgi:hypothetical protein
MTNNATQANRSKFSFDGPLFLGCPMAPTFMVTTPMGRVRVRIHSATEAKVEPLYYQTRNLFEGRSRLDSDAGRDTEYLNLRRVEYCAMIEFKLTDSTWSKSSEFYARIDSARRRGHTTLDVSKAAREQITSMLQDMVQQLVDAHPHLLTMAQALRKLNEEATVCQSLAGIDRQRQALEDKRMQAERAAADELSSLPADAAKEFEALMRSSQE